MGHIMIIERLFICNFVFFFLWQTTSSEISKYYYSPSLEKYQISYISDLSINGSFKNGGYVNCSCNEWSKLIDIPKDFIEEILLDVINEKTCNGHVICDLLRSCLHCDIQIWTCNTHPGSNSTQDCVNRTYNWLGMNNHGGSLPALLTRNRRDALGKCAYPVSMETSDVVCLVHEDPHLIECRQNCLFGHTLEEGISRVMTCNSLEGKWKPRGFEECKPFVDCSLSLKSPGNLICDQGTSLTAPSCSVACFHYEDRPEVYRNVQCLIYGGWSRKLPYCVTRPRSTELAPTPRVKLHPLSYDPYFRTSKNSQRRQGTEKA